MAPKKKEHYVDNVKFQQEMMNYLSALKKDKTLRVPEFIGKCILDIANRLAFHKNFIRFPAIRDEMIGDGIENCLRYIANYDYKKYSNPHTYFTTVCYWAFVRRIVREKRQYMIKAKHVQNMNILPQIEEMLSDPNIPNDFNEDYSTYLRSLYDVDLKAYEKKLKKEDEESE